MLRDGQRGAARRRSATQFVGDLWSSPTTAYRVRLRDADGLENGDDPEYFVRRSTIARPMSASSGRPATSVTPLEEVTIEARADDDHGLERLELVVGVRGGGEKAVPIGSGGGSRSPAGTRSISKTST